MYLVYHMVKVLIRNVYSTHLIPFLIPYLSGISLNDFFFFSEKLCLIFCIRSCPSVICFLSTLQFSFVVLNMTPVKY